MRRSAGVAVLVAAFMIMIPVSIYIDKKTAVIPVIFIRLD
jgi:hypothetical protein